MPRLLLRHGLLGGGGAQPALALTSRGSALRPAVLFHRAPRAASQCPWPNGPPRAPCQGPGQSTLRATPRTPAQTPPGDSLPPPPRPPRCAPLSLLSSPSLSHSTGRGAPRGRVSDFQTCSPGARARGPKQRSAAGSPSGFSDGTGVTVPWSHVGGVSPRTVHRLGVQTQTQGRDSPGGLSHEERQPRPPGPLPCRE